MCEASQRVVIGNPSQTRRPRRPRLGGRVSSRLILSCGAAKRQTVMHFLPWSHGPREPMLASVSKAELRSAGQTRRLPLRVPLRQTEAKEISLQHHGVAGFSREIAIPVVPALWNETHAGAPFRPAIAGLFAYEGGTGGNGGDIARS